MLIMVELLKGVTKYELVDFLLFLFALCLIVPTKLLIYVISVDLVRLSYRKNVAAIEQVLAHTLAATSPHHSTSILEDINSSYTKDLDGPISILFIQNFAIQFTLALLFKNLHLGPRQAIIQKWLPVSFMAPSILAMLPVPPNLLINLPHFSRLSLFLVRYEVWSSAGTVLHVIYARYQDGRLSEIENELSALVKTGWMRLNVPCVLRVYWVLRVAVHAILLLMDNYDEEADEGLRVSTILAVQSLASMAKPLLVTGCENMMAVLGMTSVISFFCHYIRNFFLWILLIDAEEFFVDDLGTRSAIVFYILALQTGLTSLDPEKRFIRLCRIFCLLFTSSLEFLQHLVDNMLMMSLRASHNPSMHREVRALGVCAFLIILPISFLVYLWSQHSISTWLLEVSAFSIQAIVNVFGSLMLCSLLLIDACGSTSWEQLEDYVHSIRVFGYTIEICFGILLCFNEAWIVLFESGGAFPAVKMCYHAFFYWNFAFCIWHNCIERRTIINKFNSLREASSDQLDSLDDVCAICYQEMHSAKISRCNHYFHGVCLRKWILYVRYCCPLCDDMLIDIQVT